MSENTKQNAKKSETKQGNIIARKPGKRLSQVKTGNSLVDQVLRLQRTIGNRAVTQLIQSGVLQAKFNIGKSNDIYEKEADSVADRVMSKPEESLVNSHSSLAQRESTCPECPEKEGIQTKPLAEQITPLIQRQAEEEEEVQPKLQRQAEEEEEVQTSLQRQAEEEEEKEPIQTKLIQRQGTEEEEEPVKTKLLQRQENEEEEVQTQLQRQAEEEEETAQAKASPGNTHEVTPNIESNITSMKGGGQPLSESTRSFFEPRFGTDFSQVRVHNDSRAANTAQAINARAFTTGKDIVFNSGQYSPGTSSGKRLLAHELTHVVQQEGGAKTRSLTLTATKTVQKVEPATTTAAAVAAVLYKCLIGAVIGVVFDLGFQAARYAWENWTWRFWELNIDYCSLVLSALLGCVVAPISSAYLEPWITAQLGTRLGGIAGPLIGKILLFLVKKVGVGVPKIIVKYLLKFGCVSDEQAAELGMGDLEEE